MKNKYTKKMLEEIYSCKIEFNKYYDLLNGESRTMVAKGHNVDGKGYKLFEFAEGFTLDQLHEEIRYNIVEFGILRKI